MATYRKGIPWTRHSPCPAGVEFDRARPLRMLDLTNLSEEQKRPVWERIKRERPRQAELLQDPNLHAMAEAFGADILIDLLGDEPDGEH